MEGDEMIGKSYKVVDAWKIRACKMKENDELTVIDWGSGMASNYAVFKNKRLPNYTFKTSISDFKYCTEEV